ncbi:MAG: PRC-barrel domain-containing protein [Nitrospinae bacterium]|nr:PRC-barrel domain-containing protein [Nitrospinota bacterium]MBL7019643.1 PRC-barrel domain-containing protein [Nitrospinaceae bacterium]
MKILTHVTENVFELRKIDRVIGFYLYDKSNECIARIDAVLVDSQTYHSYYMVINLGGFLQVRGKAVVLPVEVCEVMDLGKVKTEWRKESLLGAPVPTDVMSMTTLEEELIRDYYALPLARSDRSKNQEK